MDKEPITRKSLEQAIETNRRRLDQLSRKWFRTASVKREEAELRNACEILDTMLDDWPHDDA
jgi:hypothetical protein